MLDLVRGLLDGDGTIYTGMRIPNRRRYPGHDYQRLTVRFCSASRTHIGWLQCEIHRALGLEGWVTTQTKRGKEPLRFAPMHVLRYSKHESIVLLQKLYADPRAPRLRRKWKRWVAFRDHGKPTRHWTSHRKIGLNTLSSPMMTCENRGKPE